MRVTLTVDTSKQQDRAGRGRHSERGGTHSKICVGVFGICFETTRNAYAIKCALEGERNPKKARKSARRKVGRDTPTWKSQFQLGCN